MSERTRAMLCSIQVGKPRDMAADEAPHDWTSGIFKTAVHGPIHVGIINLDGDRQADLEHHGGPDRPVMLYSADHYPFWREALSRQDLAHGWFGENFTVAGLTEQTVCIGDTYQVGEVTLQISQPRNPCWKLSRRVGVFDLAAQVERTGKSGWYARVLVEGQVESNTAVVLVDRQYPKFTISYAQQVWKNRRVDVEAALELSECPYLSADWRRYLRQVAAGV
jgi:MOSC domain-containing protein YiiM